MKIIQLNMASGHFFYSTADIRQGENLASQLQITLSDDFKGYDYAMVFKLNALTPILVSPLTPVNDVITVDITNALTEQSGILQAELQAFDTVTGLLAKSAIANMKVRASILGTGEIMPEAYVPWVTVINQAAITATTQAGLAEASAVEAERQAGLAEGHATTAGESETEATRQAGIATTQAGIASGHATAAGQQAAIAEGHATTASQQAGIASGHATTASQQAGIAAGHATTASTKAGEANTSAIAAAGSASTASTKAQEASDKAAEAAATLAGTVKKTQMVNGKALSGDITINAGDIGITPSGGISATKVQGAIEELDGEKANKIMATNLITNGDFSNGTTGWIIPSGAAAVVANNSISLTRTTQGQLLAQSMGTHPANNMIFVSFKIKSNSPTLQWASNQGNDTFIPTIPGEFVNYTYHLRSAGFLLRFIIRETVAENLSEVVIKDVVFFNSTLTFGSENIPSNQDVEYLLSKFTNSFFNGTVEILKPNEIYSMIKRQDVKKVDKVAGKGLSTNDYTTEEKTALNTTIPAQLADIENEVAEYKAYDYERAYLYSTSKSIAIDYTNKTLKIISGTRILYEGKRYVVNNENQEISFLGFTASFVLQFNSVTSEVSVSQISTAGVELPKLPVIGIFHPTLPIFKMIESDHIEVNGSMFISEQIKDFVANVENESYYILDDVTGIYDKQGGIEGVSLQDTFKLEESNFNDVYNIFDELVTNYPEYVTRETIGADTTGNPIYVYNFKPVEIDDTSIYGAKKPKIIINCAIHGYEQMSSWSTMLFAKDLCENHSTKDVLNFIRWNVELSIMPVANPYGYNQNQRENFNGIDLNRNFPPSGNGGEIETQVMMQFIDNNTDAQYFIDYHNISGGYPMTYSMTRKSTTLFNQMFRVLTRKWRTNYPTAPQDVPFGYIRQSGISGRITKYAFDKGLTPLTLEAPWKMPFAASKYDKITTEVAVDLIGNLLTSICKSYR